MMSRVFNLVSGLEKERPDMVFLVFVQIESTFHSESEVSFCIRLLMGEAGAIFCPKWIMFVYPLGKEWESSGCFGQLSLSLSWAVISFFKVSVPRKTELCGTIKSTIKG